MEVVIVMAMAGSYELIRGAILRREQIVATYGGHVREMCPHAIGAKNGRAQALFFQFAGGSRSGLRPGGGWRCLPVDSLSDVVVRAGGWHTSADYAGPGTCIDEVDVEAGS
jgi:hypothetical protein